MHYASKLFEYLRQDLKTFFLHFVCGIHILHHQTFHDSWMNGLDHGYCCWVSQLLDCALDGKRVDVSHFFFSCVDDHVSQGFDDHDQVLILDNASGLLDTFYCIRLHIKTCVIEMSDEGWANSSFRCLRHLPTFWEGLHFSAEIHCTHEPAKGCMKLKLTYLVSLSWSSHYLRRSMILFMFWFCICVLN